MAKKEIDGLLDWTRRTTIDEPRLSELVELYEELGFEVLLRPVDQEELGDACRECYLTAPDLYRTIYTRPARGLIRAPDSPE
jgi:hypothetical protein